jgi:monoamine oxidase
LKEAIVKKLAEYFKEPAMLHPTTIHWNAWDDVGSIGGGPVAPFPPGVLSQTENLRKPEGRIHWAGTEMATVSTGFMDGAI